MPVTATIEVDRTDLCVHDRVWCTVRIENSTRNLLSDLNPDNARSLPTILLTDVASGEIVRHARGRPLGGDEPTENLDPGKSIEARRSLQDLVPLPGPGSYDLQSHYTWGGGVGEALSPPVRLEIRPVHPRNAFTVPSRGGTSGLLYTAWVQSAEPGGDEWEVWLGAIDPDRRPKLIESVKMGEVKRPLHPVLSVPPNTNPAVQWVAWLDGDAVYFALHRNGETCEPESLSIPVERAARIIPPLLLQSSRPGEQFPGAVATLYEPDEEGTGGQFLLLYLQAAVKGGPKLKDRIPLPDLKLIWAHTAYLSSMRRSTFLIAHAAEGGCALKVSNWSALRPPAAPADLATWDIKFVAGHVMVTRGDFARGVVLGETTTPGQPRFVLHQWAYTERGEFMSADPIPVAWPRAEGIAHAIVRINEHGAAYGLLQTDDKERMWFFCKHDGSVQQLSVPIRLPADILFRYGDDPTIMYTDPDRGFQFAKPK